MRKLTALLVAVLSAAVLAPTADADAPPIYPTFQCTPIPIPPQGGVVGATIETVRAINEAWCTFSEQTFYNAVGLAIEGLAFVQDHTPGCCITLPGPPLPTDAGRVVTDQVVGQTGLVCGFLLGPSPVCDTVAGPQYPAGTCATDVPESGGVVGDVLNLAEDSCARADVVTDYVTDYAGDVRDWVPCCIAIAPIVQGLQATVDEGVGIVSDHARNELHYAADAAVATCEAVVQYAIGESCVQQY